MYLWLLQCTCTNTCCIHKANIVLYVYILNQRLALNTTHPISTTIRAGDIPSTRSTGQDTNTLTITRAISSDDGKYYCIATNDGASRDVSLIVARWRMSTLFEAEYGLYCK